MKLVSTLAVMAALASVGVGLCSPALAQKKGQQAAQAAPAEGPKRTYSKGALKPFQELQTAATAGDAAAYPEKLAAAQAAAKTTDDRYFVAQMQLAFAQKTNDQAALRSAIDAVLRSGGATAEETPKLYKALGSLAINAKDYPAALAAYEQLLKLSPNDPDATNNMMVLYREQKNYPQAIALLEKSIAAAKAAGQKPAENTYLLAIQTALDGKMTGKIVPLTREFLTAYPSQKNWGTSLALYRQTVETDDDTLLDTFRLMRVSKTLQRSNEYIALADTLARGKFYSEARDVVNEGMAAGAYNASNTSAAAILKEVSGKIAEDKAALAGLEGRARSEARGEFALKIANGYYGHGNYAKAAEFYRVALQKGSVDTNLVNTRLGMALALSGQKPAAEAAFKAVTGPRAELANFWMIWLSQRA